MSGPDASSAALSEKTATPTDASPIWVWITSVSAAESSTSGET